MHGSDPYPIIITNIQPPHREHSERWNLEKADWTSYSKPAVTTKTVAEQLYIDQSLNHLRETILEASCRIIPNVQIGNMKRLCLPWWNEECRKERLEVRSAFRTMKRKPNRVTVGTYKSCLSIKTRTFRQVQRTSWRYYVSGLTTKTPTTKLQKRIGKISGKYIQRPFPVLKQGNNTIASQREVAEIFVANYAC